MGIDNNAVVNSELKVNGIQSLRIADASIMPTMPSGNTNAATMMIAEKASDLIKKEILIAIQYCTVCLWQKQPWLRQLVVLFVTGKLNH